MPRSFEDHLYLTQGDDSVYHVDAAERSYAAELLEDPEHLATVAAKAAKTERRRWARRASANLTKQFVQESLPGLDVRAVVQLGDNVAVELADMNHDRIRLRKDLRVSFHVDEARAFSAEMDFWHRMESVIGAEETLAHAVLRAMESVTEDADGS